MLKIEVDEFIRNLNLLDEFIETNILKMDDLLVILESIDEKRSDSELPVLISAYKSMRGYRKQFNYSAIVILLYGYFEDFIERIAKQYVKEIAALAESFEKLPKRIKTNHFSKSIELEKKLKSDKYKDVISRKEIIANLLSCENIESKEFTLNVEAYSMHTANFGTDTIDEIFADLGVKTVNQKIINEPNFSKYLRNNDVEIKDLQEGKSEFFFKAAMSKLRGILGKLAQRRNEIAHGAVVDDILSPEILQREYIDFLKQYAQSLEQVLQNSIFIFSIETTSLLTKNYTCIGSPTRIWQKGSIAEFKDVSDDMKLKITVGDELIIETSKKESKDYKKNKVLEIRVCETSQDSIEISTLPSSFTLKLDQEIKKNQIVFVKK